MACEEKSGGISTAAPPTEGSAHNASSPGVCLKQILLQVVSTNIISCLSVTLGLPAGWRSKVGLS